MQKIRTQGKQLLVGGAVVIVFLLLSTLSGRMSELQRLTAQRERAAAEATTLSSTEQALQTQIAFATSAAAVEAWAYVDGRYIRPGDHPVVPVTVSVPEATPTSLPQPTPVPQDNWEIWWALFFDDPP